MNIILIIKGFIVGIGKIIPGVSGSMLAMTLGVYEKTINAITNFFSSPKNNFKYLVNFGIGVFLAIILFSKLILFLLNNYYNETMYLFLGLILGTVIPFAKNLKINFKNIGIFILAFVVMLFLLKGENKDTFIFTGSFFNYLYIVFLGVIDAFTSIVPGISGTAIFMVLGSYQFVLAVLGNPFSLYFFIYSLGLIFGIIVTCYIMAYLLKYKKHETYSFVFAFMVGSIIILGESLLSSFNLFNLLFGLLGGYLGYLFDK